MTSYYEEGYSKCKCFWGFTPGSLILKLTNEYQIRPERKVIDVGCGEGKNAYFFAQKGHNVLAIDVSATAIENGRINFDHPNIFWMQADVRDLSLPPLTCDIIVAYGLLHCLNSNIEILRCLQMLQNSVVTGGFFLLCNFNTRKQDLSGHDVSFDPTLLDHNEYVRSFLNWEILHSADEDLYESHPHNQILHFHSMTRIIARKK